MGLTERITRNDESRTISGLIPLEHLYTVGVAGERALRELKERGQFLGTRCVACGVTYAPARLYCERCLNRLDEWIPVSLNGTLSSYTVVHRDVDDRPLDDPVVVGLIDLDGVTGSFVHSLGGVTADGFRVGQRVAARLRPAGDRVGSIADIEYFYPTG